MRKFHWGRLKSNLGQNFTLHIQFTLSQLVKHSKMPQSFTAILHACFHRDALIRLLFVIPLTKLAAQMLLCVKDTSCFRSLVDMCFASQAANRLRNGVHAMDLGIHKHAINSLFSRSLRRCVQPEKPKRFPCFLHLCKHV